MVAEISVIIATHNRSKALENTLRSLINQVSSDAFEYEIIVVDNNSKDKTKEVVKKYETEFNRKIKYIFEPCQGKTYALNTGLRQSRGNIIAFTDDDCIVDKHWLTNILFTFQSHDIDLLGGKVLPYGEFIKPKWLDLETMGGPLAIFDLGNCYRENRKESLISMTGANISIKKESCYNFGEFYLTTRSQDTEFCNRWNKLGAKIAYSPDVIVYHNFDQKRLNKIYFLKWNLLNGRNMLLVGKQGENKDKYFFRVPLWMYRKLAFSFLKMVRALFLLRKDYFPKMLNFFYQLGYFLGYFNLRTNFENLR